MRHVITIVAGLSVAGCIGPSAQLRIADIGSMPAPIVRQAWAVEVTDDFPAGATPLGSLSGTSCKNKLWDPEPTEAKALEQLQLKAVEAGATGLAAVRYETEGTSLATNCWSLVTASGVAYR